MDRVVRRRLLGPALALLLAITGAAQSAAARDVEGEARHLAARYYEARGEDDSRVTAEDAEAAAGLLRAGYDADLLERAIADAVAEIPGAATAPFAAIVPVYVQALYEPGAPAPADGSGDAATPAVDQGADATPPPAESEAGDGSPPAAEDAAERAAPDPDGASSVALTAALRVRRDHTTAAAGAIVTGLVFDIVAYGAVIAGGALAPSLGLGVTATTLVIGATAGSVGAVIGTIGYGARQRAYRRAGADVPAAPAVGAVILMSLAVGSFVTAVVTPVLPGVFLAAASVVFEVIGVLHRTRAWDRALRSAPVITAGRDRSGPRLLPFAAPTAAPGRRGAGAVVGVACAF